MAVKNDNKLKAAIRFSGISRAGLSEILGLSVPTVIERLNNPGNFRLFEFFALYNELDQDSKRLLDECLDDFKR